MRYLTFVGLEVISIFPISEVPDYIPIHNNQPLKCKKHHTFNPAVRHVNKRRYICSRVLSRQYRR